MWVCELGESVSECFYTSTHIPVKKKTERERESLWWSLTSEKSFINPKKANSFSLSLRRFSISHFWCFCLFLGKKKVTRARKRGRDSLEYHTLCSLYWIKKLWIQNPRKHYRQLAHQSSHLNPKCSYSVSLSNFTTSSARFFNFVLSSITRISLSRSSWYISRF